MVFSQRYGKEQTSSQSTKNSKNLKQNYCPISLLPIFSKVFEKLMFDSLYEHLSLYKLLDPNQSRFRPVDSVINQLLTIVHSAFVAFDCRSSLDAHSVYLDTSKAFYRVWHDGLIYKLRQNGVSGQCLALIRSFLADRMQRTVLYGKKSQWENLCRSSTGINFRSSLFPYVHK